MNYNTVKIGHSIVIILIFPGENYLIINCRSENLDSVKNDTSVCGVKKGAQSEKCRLGKIMSTVYCSLTSYLSRKVLRPLKAAETPDQTQ